MALQKQPVPINFAKGLNTKTDPYQITLGSFAALKNSVFDTLGRMTKRNGFGTLTTLPNDQQTTITTLNDSLLTTGSNLYAYSPDIDAWYDQGTVQPVHLSTQSMLRSSTSQVSPDMAVTPEGLACLVYMDAGASYYQISDSNTGQQIVPRVALPATAVNPRVFLSRNYFIVTFIAISGGAPHLQHVSIPITTPTSPRPVTDISSSVASISAGYDGCISNDVLYLAWSSTGTTVRVAYLSASLIISAPKIIPASVGSLVSVAVDNSTPTPVVWVSYYDSGTTTIKTTAYSYLLAVLLAPVTVVTTPINELTSIADNSTLTLIYENQNTYSYAPSAKSDYVSKIDVTQLGVVGSPTIILRSVGLASKPFYNAGNTTRYVLVTYGGPNQPTYFLIDLLGNIYMRLAYSNGGGYASSQVLPSVTYMEADSTWVAPYMIKDFLATVNKGTQLPAGTPTNSIYTQTGINLARFSINTSHQDSSSIADCLHLTGGQLWQYDGVKPVEHSFHVWPEDVTAVWSATGGSIAAKPDGSTNTNAYYYAFTYEWTDNQGNLHRSAPSIPTAVTTTGAGTAGSITLNVPTLRLTYKSGTNPVRIVGYRWSVAQQSFYQFTSITSPVVNSTTTDSVTIVDTAADSAILGQTLLYTTGGVVENIAAPASIDSALFKNRLFLIDAENPNLLWYSKVVIQNTPVEMSDLFTVYVAPTTGAQGSTGDTTAISAMDDKLIIFKRNAAYYITGTGPDNTGANNDFTDPVFIASSVGCAVPNSIVLTPNGLMFQSDKGIWLLGRDLSTSYIGAPVEAYNDFEVKSAEVIPGTNQVRFILSNNITLMYDYFVGEWGVFDNYSAVSATLYEGLHTYLSSSGIVYRETPGKYLDGSKPVLMSFTTSWINVAGLQGYERFYFMYILGTYFTPFNLNVTIAYDYNPSFSQQTQIRPDNYTPNYGGESVWGGAGPWGGPGNVFEARVFPQQQKCESFQLSVTETYDPSFGQPAGQGLAISGLNLIVGLKKGYRVQKASRSFG